MDRPLRLKHKSSQIHEGSTYDPETGRLTAVLNGAVAAYHGVHPDIIDGLEKAESPGKYFHEHIKGPKEKPIHEYSRVR